MAKEMTDVMELAKREGVCVVMSAHFFSGMPEENLLTELFAKMQDAGCDIAKIAAMAKRQEDVDAIKNASLKAGDFPKVALAMGEKGLSSRIYPEKFDSIMTFVCDEMASAPGQMDIEMFIKRRKELKTKNKVEKSLKIL